MKKTDVEQNKEMNELIKRFSIVTNCKLYNALQVGKGLVLAEVMNKHLYPPIPANRVHMWFRDPINKVPKMQMEAYLELMADALRFVAEEQKKDMSEKAITLKKESDKASEDLRTVKAALAQDVILRAQLEEQR